MRLSDPRLAESSGLAASARWPGLLWTVADSGNPAQVYGIRGGRVLAVAEVAGARNVDWEAIARGPGGTLWIGDIGDNDRSRRTITLYEIAEPGATGRTSVPARQHRLRYPDGPHDAEALLVHPRTGAIAVVTKELLRAGSVYGAARPSGRGVTTLRRLGDAPPVVTDGAWAPDGRRLALRTYVAAQVREELTGPGRRVPLPAQPQGEALTWTADGRALLAGSEGVGTTVWRVPLPTPSPAASPTRTPAAHNRGGAGGGRLAAGLVGLGAAAAVGAVGAVGAVAMRIRRSRRVKSSAQRL